MRLFLLDHVFGYEQLAALLHLVRAPEQELTAEDVAAATSLAADTAEAALAELAAEGELVTAVLRAGGAAYLYRPRTQEAHLLIQKLVEIYQQQPLAIVRMLSKNALQRVRSAAAVRLAEAFRINQGKK